MKHLILLFVLGITLVSCNKIFPCEADDFVGIYTGTVDCDGGDSKAATYEIFKESNEYFLKDNDGITLEIVINDCEFTIPSQSIILFSLEGSGTLSGNNLEVQLISTTLGETSVCNFEGDQ